MNHPFPQAPMAPPPRSPFVPVRAVAPDACPQCGTVVVPLLVCHPGQPTALVWAEATDAAGRGRLHGDERCLAVAVGEA